MGKPTSLLLVENKGEKCKVMIRLDKKKLFLVKKGF